MARLAGALVPKWQEMCGVQWEGRDLFTVAAGYDAAAAAAAPVGDFEGSWLDPLLRVLEWHAAAAPAPPHPRVPTLSHPAPSALPSTDFKLHAPPPPPPEAPPPPPQPTRIQPARKEKAQRLKVCEG